MGQTPKQSVCTCNLHWSTAKPNFDDCGVGCKWPGAMTKQGGTKQLFGCSLGTEQWTFLQCTCFDSGTIQSDERSHVDHASNRLCVFFIALASTPLVLLALGALHPI